MNILINTQSFEEPKFYETLEAISNNANVQKIFITSSLMHTLNNITIEKYAKIQKTFIIDTITLFNAKTFINDEFILDQEFLENEEYMFTDFISSYRWLPVTHRNENDLISFTMRYYYDVYNFWNQMFKKYQIDFVLQLNDEHSSLDSILIRVALKYKIPKVITTLMVGMYSKNQELYYGLYDNSNSQYISLKEYDTNHSKSQLDISKGLLASENDYNKSQRVLKRYIKPLLLLLNTNKNFLETSQIILDKVYLKIKQKILLTKQYYYMKDLAQYYNKVSVKNLDLEKKYIYYCIHFDPEAATLPKDNAYFNQLLNLRILSSSLPKDWIIYIKEHPHQLQYELYKKEILANHVHSVDNFRSKNYYNYILSIPNVKLVHFENNHHKMIQSAQFVASNTGTVYREATLYGKHCISFSKASFYDLLDNVHNVKDVESCKNVINTYKERLDVQNLTDKIFGEYSILIEGHDNIGSNVLSFINRNILRNTNA